MPRTIVGQGGVPALEPTFSVRQIHEMTGVPLSTIYKAVRTGQLRASCLPGMTKGYRVPRHEAERYFGGRTDDAAADQADEQA